MYTVLNSPPLYKYNLKLILPNTNSVAFPPSIIYGN